VADQLERATNLLALLLETRVPLTLEDIANQLAGQYPDGHAARRGAFERDKSLLRDVGVPIETEVLSGERAGQTAYRVDRDRYELRGLQLTDAERRALQLAVAMVRTTEGEVGMLKLGDAVDAPAPTTANLPQFEVLPALREAIGNRAAVTFRYHGTDRSLHPYALLLREGFWYVIGHDVARGEVRTYRVDRIEGDVEPGTPDEFVRPPDFDPRHAFPPDPKELGGAERMATVRIGPRRASFALRELGEDAVLVRLPDGSLEVEVPCGNVDAFRSWLFGWGVHAEVVGPDDIRAAVVDWLRMMVVPA